MSYFRRTMNKGKSIFAQRIWLFTTLREVTSVTFYNKPEATSNVPENAPSDNLLLRKFCKVFENLPDIKFIF